MNPLSQFVSGSTLRDFFTEEAGQQRRAWLERQGQAIGDAAQYYLGPTGIPTRIGAAAELLNFTDAGDVVAAGEASQALWNDPSVANAANYAAAGAAMALPFYSARMGEGLASAADDAVRYFVDEDGAIRVWHGSPHDFDRFSMDKIGTGEGAQAYGHGLYFAENRGVAESYRDVLSGDVSSIGDMAVNTTRNPDDAIAAWRAASGHLPQDVRDAVSYKLGQRLGAAEILDDLDVDFYGEFNDDVARILRSHPGRLYEVAIDANPEDFLDWDAPLSAQPQRVQDWFDSRGITHGFAGNQSGAELMMAETSLLGADGVADAMRGASIPGVRYLDHGSRFNAVDGIGPETRTRNYVVFDDRLVSILNKYGLAGVAAMTGGQMLGSYGEGVTEDDRNAMQAYLDGL